MSLNEHISCHTALKQLHRQKIHVLHKNNALICKIHHTVRQCFNMFMRILTLSILRVLELLHTGTMNSRYKSFTVLNTKKVSKVIFSILIMDLG